MLSDDVTILGIDELPATAAGKPTARSRKSDKKREAIIAAATEIINAKTYALATMTEIAAALDLRDAALYYYYPSKQALAYACHLRSMERFESFLVAADRDGTNGADKLERFLSILITDSDRHGPLLYFGDYFHLEATERKSIAASAARLTAILEQFLKTGIDDKSIEPCETGLVVNLLLGMLIWLAKWTNSVEGLTVSRLVAAIKTTTLKGLGNQNAL